MKKNNSVLLCFSRLASGKALSRLATAITWSKSEKSSITLLYFIDKAGERCQSEEMHEYRQKIIADFMPAEEREKITLRLFAESYDDYQGAIARISEEQKSNLILMGVSSDEFDPGLVKRYGLMKNNPAYSDSFILEQFEEREAGLLKGINTVFSRNTQATGLLIDRGASEFRKLFVPILHKADMHIFAYLYRIGQQENVKIMLWDAIGIFQSDPKMQKLYQSIVKKTEGRIYLWNNDKKIGCDFIEEQDLVIIGTEGWSKLVCTPLQWTDSLPSTFIIKEHTNPL